MRLFPLAVTCNMLLFSSILRTASLYSFALSCVLYFLFKFIELVNLNVLLTLLNSLSLVPVFMLIYHTCHQFIL